MCQTHSAAKKAMVAGQRVRLPGAGAGKPVAISGAAISRMIMCWAARAENSATDSAQSGDSVAAAKTAQPMAVAGPFRPFLWHHVECQIASTATTAINGGSRLKRPAKSPGIGGSPQYATRCHIWLDPAFGRANPGG